MNKTAKTITQGAAIAAIYVVLTILANAFGLANHAIQVRFSEALTILPYFTPVAIPGLFVGCIIANIVTGCMPLDTVFGSMATLLGALGTYLISNKLNHNKTAQYLAPVPPIIANTLIVPFVLAYVYKFEGSIPYFMLTVGIGEIISCGILGLILLKALYPRREHIF
ncbi:MAG: QueT transporter family protein [Lachnospiraceae bacterium]|nr:QueT transporter family protein [Lachnospiraceae bacterium]